MRAALRQTLFNLFLIGTAALSAGPAAGVAGAPAPSGPSTPIHDPEIEMALAKTDLDNLARRLEAAKQLATRPGLGPQTAIADRAWKNALAYFDHKEWLSAVRELNHYLNRTQVPALGAYVRAQFMLGRAYEEMGYKSKALRAYFRYLGAYLTAKEQDHEEMVDVLRRMIPLAADASNAKGELNQLLASITTLDLPEDIQPIVFYYAAKSAALNGQPTMATTWLEKPLAAPNDPVLKAKALYMRALIAIAKKDYAGAEEILSEVIQTDKEGTARDQARLALARLALHQRRRETALKYYALIHEDSAAFKDATFESLYVHLDLKQDAEARAKALLYVARWPDTPEALQLRMLLAYLDMRAGQLDAAGQSIAAADQRLHDINAWMEQKLSGKTTLSQTTLTDLMTMTGGQLPVAPSVAEAAQLFARLAEAARRLADLRGDVRNVLYTIGRADPAHMRPQWVNRAESLAGLGDDLLKVGHRLAAAERHLYQDRLDPVDQQRLAASESRRTRLLTPPAARARKSRNWATYAQFMDLTKQVADAYDKLQKVNAELVGARYAAAVGAKHPAGGASRLAELETEANKLSQSLAKALAMLRVRKVRDLLVESPHRAVGKFLAQYATALHEEGEILAKARDGSRTTAQRLNADEGARLWGQWEFLAGETFRQIAGLDQEIATSLDELLAELDAEEARYAELEAKLHDITGALETHLGQSLSYIIDQYANAINTRFARNQKWKADIDWLTYQSKLDEDRKLEERTALEQQILKDHLTDLQQGVLWQWPK